MPRDLFVLALDHRGSIERLHEITPPPTPAQEQRIRAGKQLVFDGLAAANERLPGDATAAVLVDEQYGGDLVAQAADAGMPVAVCVERSGTDLVEFEHADWQRHIDAVAPDYAKVLTRYHPDSDAHDNVLQHERLRALGAFLATTPATSYLLELIVPPSTTDLAAVDDDHDRFVAERRGDLVVAAIEQLRRAGVEPDVWKVEGLAATEDCRRVADVCRSGGRDDVGVVVLGAGASLEVVTTWLEAAAPVDGYRGFAVGRTIWSDELAGHLAGDATTEQVRDQVAANYLSLVETWLAAA